MCGHGIIAVVTMVIETGQFEVKENSRKFIIDSPAGKVIAYAKCNAQKIIEVAFENVPSFVYKKDFAVKVDGHEFYVDIAFGGAFYAILESVKLNLQVNNEDLPDLQNWGMKMKHNIEENLEVKHPRQSDLKDIYGVIFSD